MRILEIVPTLEQEASGPSYSVPRLARALAERGNEVLLLSAGGQAVDVEPPLRHARFARDFGRTPILKKLEISEGLRRALLVKAPASEIIHANGLWTLPTVYPAWAARRSSATLVCSPRGTLNPIALQRSPLRKRLFWRLAQRRATAQAALLHATSEQEYLDIRAFGLKQPVAVIPIGIDLPADQAAPHRPEGPRRLLYLGRLHPIKGLENLLRAWAAAAAMFNDWELALVGPGDEAYVAGLRRLADNLRLPRLTFAGPSYGDAKREAYARADLYVLPSLTENFGVSVAEALAQGLPVITTIGTPWAGVVTEGCGWRVSPDVEGLTAALADALAKNPAELRRMGEAGRAWVRREYAWERVAEQMEVAFRWAREGGSTPATIRLG